MELANFKVQEKILMKKQLNRYENVLDEMKGVVCQMRKESNEKYEIFEVNKVNESIEENDHEGDNENVEKNDDDEVNENVGRD